MLFLFKVQGGMQMFMNADVHENPNGQDHHPGVFWIQWHHRECRDGRQGRLPAQPAVTDTRRQTDRVWWHPSNSDIQKQSPVCLVPCLWTSIVERPCASLNTNLSETRWSTVNDNRPAPCTAIHTHTNNLYSNEVKESLGLLIWAQLWGPNTAPLSWLQQKIQKVIHEMKWNGFAKWTYPT